VDITHHTHWQVTDNGLDSHWMTRAFDESYKEILKAPIQDTVVFRTLDDAQAFGRRVLERYCDTSPPCKAIPDRIKRDALRELGLPEWAGTDGTRTEVRVVGDPVYGRTVHGSPSVTRTWEVRFGRTRTTVRAVEMDGESYFRTVTSEEWSSWHRGPDPEVVELWVSKVVTTVIG